MNQLFLAGMKNSVIIIIIINNLSMKKLLYIFIVFGLVLTVNIVFAKPNFSTTTNPAGKDLKFPDFVLQVAPNVFYLGTSFDVDSGKLVQGYAIMHGKKKFVKPGTICGDGICQPGENINKCPEDCGGGDPVPDSSCYGFLAREAKWKSIEPWIVSTVNASLDGNFLLSNLAADIDKWEDAAEFEILGGGSVTNADPSVDYGELNGDNEVYFGNLGDGGTIAVTYIWGIFGGRPSNRELVEWDQIYNTYYQWSDSGQTGMMDFENIATHELGHSVGLGDLYTSDCSEETMYGYASYGETKKQTLELGDITGIKALY